ncbi:hypothetical protein BOTBODRAFT_174671 [Botryobasidium botryosum FD-172 SS1]|uniref:Cytochrome P450 n=1 Tax=Botryobasidium botryosum (strain FD-172 SS1) TaxID=930990 RepID=A0A067MG34_BOTB1|nr:hypothetical protein BOTBODRAFT_174671 [Botryobasidium botryosum FD-172 SS1]
MNPITRRPSPEKIAMLNAILALGALFALSRLYKFWSGLKAVNYVPGMRSAFGARSNVGFLLRTRLNSTLFSNGLFEGDTDITSVVPWLHGEPYVIVSSMKMMHQVLGYSDTYDKELSTTDLFGVNVATVRKGPWKRHRRIVHPSFSNKLYSLVWKESMQTFRDIIEAEGWDKTQSVAIPVLSDLTSKCTLTIVTSCAFGIRSPWSDSIAQIGQGLPLGKCLELVTEDAPVRLLTPKWAYFLPIKAIKREKIAGEDVASDSAEGNNTIFNTIIKANMDGGKFAFDDEVIGNTFIMLFAGHETTSRTLNALLTLLALYQEEQEKAYQEIKRVLPDGRDPTFEDFESFTQIRNCIQETMRIYPSVNFIIREAMEDTQLNVTNRATGDVSHTVVLEKGARVLVNVVGIHRNPRHFPDPDIFKSSRWDDDSIDTDAFAGFGQGPRACIGRKFSLAEATCFVYCCSATGESKLTWRRAKRASSGSEEF